MLTELMTLERLRQVLTPAGRFLPYPRYRERDFWEALPPDSRHAAVSAASETLGLPWPAIPATAYVTCKRTGDRQVQERPYFARRSRFSNLVMAECMEGKGRFLGDILDGLWTTCEETYWGLAAHLGMQREEKTLTLPDVTEPTVDLFAAETAAMLAWTDYLLGPELGELSALVRPRLRFELERRIFEPCMARDDFWWLGFRGGEVNNWNPWVNSNWLACVLLCEEREDRRLAAIGRILRSLDVFIAHASADGGCDEGPSYWNRAAGSLFDALDLILRATHGAFDGFADPVVAELGRFIYRVHIAGRWFVNFADGSACVELDGMHIFRFGERIGDAAMRDFGLWLSRLAGPDDPALAPGQRPTHPIVHALTRVLPDLGALARRPPRGPASAPLPAFVHLPDTEVMTARDAAGSERGFFLAVKGGHNAESHNHNDVGQFVVFLDGLPLLIDPGVESYRLQTFSADRYTIWTMQSAWHNLPTINGCQQAAGREFRSGGVRCTHNANQARFELDIAGAYPPAANVRRWRRAVGLERGQAVCLVDEYALDKVTAPLQLHALTPSRVEVLDGGAVRLHGVELPSGCRSADGRLAFDAGPGWRIAVEERPLADARMGAVWGERLYRIVFENAAPPPEGTITWRLSRPPADGGS